MVTPARDVGTGKRLKIAIVYDVIYPDVVGGVQLRNWEVARRLSQRGHDVTLFGTKHWTGSEVIDRGGVKIHGVGRARDLYRGGRRAYLPPLAAAVSLLPPLSRERYDIVDVANFPYFPVLSARGATLKTGSRLVVTWHEAWGRYWREYLGRAGIIAQAIEKICARLSANAIAVSEMTKRDLRNGGYRAPIEVIPCGVDVAHIGDVPPGEESDVIFIGRLIKEKQVDLLLRATAQLAREFPSIRCAVIGDGPERDAVVALVKSLRLERNVRLIPFVPRHDDVIAHLKASRVLVHPSSREGFGIVALEANACGIPVIVADFPRNACRDLVRSGENGFVSQPTEDDLAREIGHVLRGGGPRPESCVAVASRYDWDTVVTSLESYYAERRAS